MAERVQSEDFARWEACGLRSPEGELGRERVRTESVDWRYRGRRDTSADHGQEIECEPEVVAGRKVDRVPLRPAGANHGNGRRKETTLRNFRGRRRSATGHESGKRCQRF